MPQNIDSLVLFLSLPKKCSQVLYTVVIGILYTKSEGLYIMELTLHFIQIFLNFRYFLREISKEREIRKSKWRKLHIFISSVIKSRKLIWVVPITRSTVGSSRIGFKANISSNLKLKAVNQSNRFS